ncbi:bifunctional non-homologous end joining protein LigD [Amycolatopsis arida]|uniref:DNA ligase (ATP) n=1 Tax=Amycolatopsis arida TaxID=587909 RepID=A0A1I5YDZ5_9PSEU|nr:DNA polymerase ligase N-terminal domain-containing protein [Amycolatopsis arida]TDX90449.1 bifunctional non-homologous end joining protein LigD [Amycolatopsis arida]SFQ42454.1 bifunctional non-homologous end joining protein LigD [Amycolatopsis arida]
MAGLSEYRRKRDPRRTPEPVPADDPVPRGDNDTFVIQEHHARRLHWDVRLERDGVLVSWAVPKGLPPEPGTPRLAVHTEDHPLEYATFEGEIPAGEYGGGRMLIWDRGRYETLHWSDHKVEIALHGERVRGRYVFVHRHGQDRERDWLVRRKDPAEPGWVELPEFLPPMRARDGELPGPDEDAEWAYEFAWGGRRAEVRAQGGRVSVLDEDGADLTALLPELRGLGEQLGATEALLDGELVAFDAAAEATRPSPEALRRRLAATGAQQARRLADRAPVVYLPFDVLHLAGRSCLDLPYLERRRLLAGLGLEGPHWRVPEHHVGGGPAVLRTSRQHGLAGMIAKRAGGRYLPGRPSPDWTRITGGRVQEVVVGGWRAAGDEVAALLVGVPEDGDPRTLRYVGTVRSGLGDDRQRLRSRLRRRARKRPPFSSVPRGGERDVHWVRPDLVGEVAFRDWTSTGRLRSPRWRGLCPDRRPEEVVVDG